jgi:hypothetical protein
MLKPSRHFSRGLSALTLLVASALPVHAHPGHSLLDATATHALTSPYHLAVLVLSGVTLFFGARLVQRQRPRRLLQAAGVIAVVSAGVIWASHS